MDRQRNKLAEAGVIITPQLQALLDGMKHAIAREASARLLHQFTEAAKTGNVIEGTFKVIDDGRAG